MKLKQIYCPSCGGSINGDLSENSVFCPFCGQQLYIDHEKKEVTINKNININKVEHKHYYDEAEIAKHKSEANKNMWDTISVVLLFLIFFIFVFILW